jgi:RND family efflux transporter MFP subunit
VETVRTGDLVARGTPLLSIQSPELYQSESEFLIALAARDSGAHEHDKAMLEAARSRLRLQGVPGEEIDRLERTRQASQRLTLRSPVAGTVLERNVLPGQSVGPDTPLLTVADLTRVWVLVDLYERDLAVVRIGSRARFETDALPGRAIEGAVEFVYPTVDPETRTVKARLVLDNHDRSLRPGMFGRVRVRGAAMGGRIVLPSEAVINTGAERYVFLARTGGRFEPRLVVVGREEADGVEIVSGIAAGDTVVASGTFLIDSESRLEAALGGMGGAAPAAKAPAADPHGSHK